MDKKIVLLILLIITIIMRNGYTSEDSKQPATPSAASPAAESTEPTQSTPAPSPDAAPVIFIGNDFRDVNWGMNKEEVVKIEIEDKNLQISNTGTAGGKDTVSIIDLIDEVKARINFYFVNSTLDSVYCSYEYSFPAIQDYYDTFMLLRDYNIKIYGSPETDISEAEWLEIFEGNANEYKDAMESGEIKFSSVWKTDTTTITLSCSMVFDNIVISKSYKPIDYVAQPVEPKIIYGPYLEIPEVKEDVNILFIGNSQTLTGSLALQIKNISSMYGINVNYTDISRGGVTLADTKSEALKQIQENNFDFVVMQEGRFRETKETESFLADVKIISDEARKYGGVPVLYNSAMHVLDNKPYVLIQNIFTEKYVQASYENQAILVNSGEAWIYVYDKIPDIMLYNGRDYHPSVEGAYFTACVFVSTLFNIHVEDVCETNIYKGDRAVELGQAAWEYVSYFKENKNSPKGIALDK